MYVCSHIPRSTTSGSSSISQKKDKGISFGIYGPCIASLLLLPPSLPGALSLLLFFVRPPTSFHKSNKQVLVLVALRALQTGYFPSSSLPLESPATSNKWPRAGLTKRARGEKAAVLLLLVVVLLFLLQGLTFPALLPTSPKGGKEETWATNRGREGRKVGELSAHSFTPTYQPAYLRSWMALCPRTKYTSSTHYAPYKCIHVPKWKEGGYIHGRSQVEVLVPTHLPASHLATSTSSCFRPFHPPPPLDPP